MSENEIKEINNETIDIKELYKLIQSQQQQINELKTIIQNQQKEHEKQIKQLHQKMKEEITKLQLEIHQVETYFDDDIPKFENDQDYRDEIFNKLDFIGNITCSKGETWKNIYRHFFVRTNSCQFFDINKKGILVGFKKWNDEKTPAKRIYPKRLMFLLTVDHYFEIKLKNPFDDLISIGLVNDNSYHSNETIGIIKESIGFDSNGYLRISNGTKELIGNTWKWGDVVGCGFCLSQNIVYFTMNGLLLCKVKTNCREFYPAFQKGNYKDNDYSVNFGEDEFKFDDIKFMKQFE